MRRLWGRVAGVLMLFALPDQARASAFGDIRGKVEDPQGRAVAAATVILSAISSSFSQTKLSDDRGHFAFGAVPLGEYDLTVSMSGFAGLRQPIMVRSTGNPTVVLRLQLVHGVIRRGHCGPGGRERHLAAAGA